VRPSAAVAARRSRAECLSSPAGRAPVAPLHSALIGLLILFWRS
jgi:hypothetical protein